MGTRHLVEVIDEWEIKIAQYWQWDWYIEWQGFEILDFLRNKENIKKLKEGLKKVKFYTWEEDFIKDYIKSEEKRDFTKEQLEWFKTYISRDLGAEILTNVASIKDGQTILLQDSRDFKEDSLFCEYYYIIDLDKMTLDINGYKTYDINNLPSNEEVLKDFNE